MRKKPTSTADIIAMGKGLLEGAERNIEDINRFHLDIRGLDGLIESFIQQNALQEKLKGDLRQATKDLASIRNQLRREFGKWVSVLEGQYGKDDPKLQEFGIPPRMLRPYRGPRQPEGEGARAS